MARRAELIAKAARGWGLRLRIATTDRPLAFDELAKDLARGMPRREALRRLGGGLLGAMLASVGLENKAWAQGNLSGAWFIAATGPSDIGPQTQSRCDYCSGTVPPCLTVSTQGRLVTLAQGLATFIGVQVSGTSVSASQPATWCNGSGCQGTETLSGSVTGLTLHQECRCVAPNSSGVVVDGVGAWTYLISGAVQSNDGSTAIIVGTASGTYRESTDSGACGNSSALFSAGNIPIRIQVNLAPP